ncbi:MAG: hypothetical protein V4672_12340 [Verrucomicrobiota bacterium]
MNTNYTYYRTRLEDIEDPQLSQLFVDLRAEGGWPEGEHNDLTVFSFLSLYFLQTRAGLIKQNNVTPISSLDKKVSSLAGSEVHLMCREVAHAVGEYFEAHENRKVLSFLKAMMKKLKKTKR